MKAKAKTLLTSEQDISKKTTLLGCGSRFWKHNMNFKHFMLRRINKVYVEIRLIAMVHNLKKYSLAI
ncbi:MAG: hypothetical protein ACTJGA_08785 [Mesonia hippocampi]|uniref:hypothetical protein n=1 Tax=Mesonia hippocampi TaxID=1628250 RepID=UPI003F9A77F5